jgi:uncharacterized membrane protein YeiH
MNVPLIGPAIQPLLPWLDLAGIAVFAASGALAAARKRLDIVGAGFFALVTAVGGGTLRDLLIAQPVFWIVDPRPILICLGVAIAIWVTPRRWWQGKALDWFDAAGLAAYAVYGAGKAMHFGVSPLPAAAMGVVSACMGGIIRDMIAGVPSIMLRHELYVTPAIVASGLFVGLTALGLEAPAPMLLGTVAGFLLRGAAIRWRLALPAYRS